MYFCTNLVGTLSSEAFGGKVIREASPESLCATSSASASLKAHPNDHSQQALQLLRHDVAGVLSYFAVYCDFRYQPCMCRGERRIRADFPDRFRSLDVRPFGIRICSRLPLRTYDGVVGITDDNAP